MDYPNGGGFNCSVLQLNQSTYLSNQTTVPNVTSTNPPYTPIWSTGYDWSTYTNNTYSAAGVCEIPLQKIVIGLGSYMGVGINDYVPLSSTSQTTYSGAISYTYPTIAYMSNYISQCSTVTSPYNSASGQTTPFYFDTNIITSWYNNGGGIMIYDFQSTGSTTTNSGTPSQNVYQNNYDVQSYFSEVYNNL